MTRFSAIVALARTISSTATATSSWLPFFLAVGRYVAWLVAVVTVSTAPVGALLGLRISDLPWLRVVTAHPMAIFAALVTSAAAAAGFAPRLYTTIAIGARSLP